MLAANYHLQFCAMVGMPPQSHPSLPPELVKIMPKPSRDLLYQRALRRRNSQNRTYLFTASLANTLLLMQVVLGATVTGLGASDSSHILITIFGATNTIIAGLVAYLKSRGQPMRARMYSEDLDRLVDEIENSAIMWLGISADVHGYDAIDIDSKVTVRGEVARLTRLWDAAIRRNVANDPDMYAASGSQHSDTEGLRGPAHGPVHVELPAIVPSALPAPPAVPDTPVETPHTVSDGPSPGPKAEAAKASEDGKDDSKPAAGPQPPNSDPSKDMTDKPLPPQVEARPAPAAPPMDPDASPATAPLEHVSSLKRSHGSYSSSSGGGGGSAEAAKANDSMKRTV